MGQSLSAASAEKAGNRDVWPPINFDVHEEFNEELQFISLHEPPRAGPTLTPPSTGSHVLETTEDAAEHDQPLDPHPLARPKDLSVQSYILGDGIIDPFLATPIPLDHVGKELVANIFHAPNQRAHRDDWFAVGLGDQATFHQVLANSALYLYGLHHQGRGRGGKGRESKLAIMYHQLAVSSVRKRLAGLVRSDGQGGRRGGENEEGERQRTIEALIRCVSGMICMADIVASAERWHMHRQGLVQLIRLRKGGLHTLDAHLRPSVSWVELRGAYMHELPPHFPLPDTWLESFRADRRRALGREAYRAGNMAYTTQIRLAWSTHFPRQPVDPPWLPILEDLVLLSPLADADFAASPPGSGLEDLRELPVWTNVLIHRLLSLQTHPPAARSSPAIHNPSNSNPTTQHIAHALSEASRLAMLLFLAPLWRAYGVRPTPTQTLLPKLHDLLHPNPQLWRVARSHPALGKLLRWILCVAALEAIGLAADEWRDDDDDDDGDGDGVDVNADADAVEKECAMRDWFAQTLFGVAALTGTALRDAGDVEGVMKATLWVREIFDGRIRALGRRLAKETTRVANGQLICADFPEG
ncbi:hypothetical protein LTR36_000843 [Oleoguttula mirabilis]|uniref:Uncharacterized protein n=1 Tax=Oleoguttula mirabilis TaxID=1507867 RepID=A0AAV9J3Y0_9PEZI|nr:hypothetical protein LTR36_000843 [Oleoguttula mirabilis]